MQPSLIYVGNEDYCRACHTAMPIIKAEAHDLGLPVTWYDTDEDMVAKKTKASKCLYSN